APPGKKEPSSAPVGTPARTDPGPFAKQYSRPSGNPALDPHPVPPEENGQDRPFIRPYVLTGGRTRPQYKFALHSMLMTTDKGRSPGGNLSAEHLAICLLCRIPYSVAEVAALLAVPLGVARVLLSDMVEQRLVTVISPSEDRSPSIEILE